MSRISLMCFARILKNHPIHIAIILIVISGFAVYGNFYRGQLIWDDAHLIEDNLFIRSWSLTPRIFTGDIAAGSGARHNFYRPFQIFTHMVDYHLWGMDIRWHHLNNVLLHVLVALGVFWLVTLLFKDKWVSLFAGMLFVVHPVNSEVAMWLSARADSLCFLFVLLSFVFYVKYLAKRKFILYAAMVLSFTLALLSKENSLVFPVLLLAYHYVFREKVKLKVFLAPVVLSFSYVLLRISVLPAFRSPLATSSLWQRIPGFFAAITNYLTLMILPLNQRADYGNLLFSFSDPRAVTGIIIVILSLFLAFMKRENRLVVFSLAWFFIALLPLSNIYPLHSYMAERWLYMPAMGIFVLAAGGLRGLRKTKRFKTLSTGCFLFLVLFYSGLTFRQTVYWCDPVAFYERIISNLPQNARAYNNLGSVYARRGRMKEARELYKKAVELAPDSSPRYYKNLGFTYIDDRNYEEAEKVFKRSLDIWPDSVETCNILGFVYTSMGREDKAIEIFSRAIEVDPSYPKSYYNLGTIYQGRDQADEALKFYKKALEIDPDYAQVHNNLAVIYYYLGLRELAVEHCRKALQAGHKVHPDFLKLLDYRQ